MRTALAAFLGPSYLMWTWLTLYIQPRRGPEWGEKQTGRPGTLAWSTVLVFGSCGWAEEGWRKGISPTVWEIPREEFEEIRQILRGCLAGTL